MDKDPQQQDQHGLATPLLRRSELCSACTRRDAELSLRQPGGVVPGRCLKLCRNTVSGRSFVETPGVYPLVMSYKKLLKMTIEIVDLPIENGDFPWFFVSLPEGSMI